MDVQLAPLSLLYSQRVSAPLPPVNVEDRVIFATPGVAVGLEGLEGLVRKAGAVASSVVQPLSLYAL